ncbi:enoyl-CoA hydratase/isomerase family protein [Spongiivirga sp. MCCC 1A20706]|uniref:enoyl-CoA hydratase/isomerase family protein n=1 Tax=Spongiivirga sp. MCCC 1A20706 TaxID=3160963 RepID=UPI003977B65B
MNTIQIEKKEHYTIVQLNRGKVNAINHEMVKELTVTFTKLENDHEVKGVILTGTPHFFSAGLDVIELYGYDEEQIEAFFKAFGQLHIQMATFKKPMICAITGHAPAGGCVFAITADYRIMAEGDKYTIGLNEVAVNIQISNNLIDAYSFWIGRGKAHEAILDGKLFKAQEALSCGLVNKVVALEEVLPMAERKMKQFLKANETILVNTKQKLRKSWLRNLETDGGKDLGEAIELWWSPEIRSKMKDFVESLQKK